MGKKLMVWKTKGMNQDTSVSAFSPEFSFENRNLRLSTNEGNTQLSWVNEKGTKYIQLWEESTISNRLRHIPANPLIEINLRGIPIGTAVINHQLVVFTTGIEPEEEETDFKGPDAIYCLWYAYVNANEKLICNCLYQGHLNFDTDSPLETLVSYESETVQKVYWTDGRNQPRLINIAADREYTDTSFDFVSTVQADAEMSIVKNNAGGLFAPGVIQYCFSYVNQYGQQSNVVDVSTLYYLAYEDGGASPEAKVANSFTITIDNLDTNFDNVRIYSIQRTSLNADVIVKILDTLDISDSGTITYTDNGTTGTSIDPFELLYAGGKEITALTMAEKDHTLFLGNIEEKNSSVEEIQEWVTANPIQVSYDKDTEHSGSGYENVKTYTLEPTTGYYSNTNTLNKSQREITTFKGGETYRFGFQLQKKTGEWSEPVFIGDYTNTYYPSTSLGDSDNVHLVYAQSTIPWETIKEELSQSDIDFSVYQKIRPVIVYPGSGESNVVCQGVLNPTVFNAKDRIDNSPYAQASWYFRPYILNDAQIDPQAIWMNEAMPASPDISKDSRFNANEFTAVSVLVVLMNDENANNLRINKTISMTYFDPSEGESGSVVTRDKAYYRLIHLGTTNNPVNRNAYALTFTEALPQIYGLPDALPTDWNYHSGLDFWLYNNLQVDNSREVYYTKNISDDPYSYIFKFYVDEWYQAGPLLNNHYMTLTFPSIPFFQGVGVPFTHYDSLFTTDDLLPSHDYYENVTLAHRLEVQGSRKLYDSPFSTLNPNRDSNGQFFVDQSIITLNSPDIEFNTEVQSDSFTGLSLHIVGEIPITANVSSHAITTSSNMLETNHNRTTGNYTYGTGELDYNVTYNNKSSLGGNRLASEYLWRDVTVFEDENYDDHINTSDFCVDYLVYPWQRTGSLNNDYRANDVASSLLKTKKESNLLYSFNTAYLSSGITYENVQSKIHLTENDFVRNIRLPKQKDTSSEINYYPNIDKVLYSTVGYPAIIKESESVSSLFKTLYSPVSMKYKSTSHVVIALPHDDTSNQNICILPYLSYGAARTIGGYNGSASTSTFWGDTNMTFSQSGLGVPSGFDHYNMLFLGELHRTVINQFGGTTKEALRANTWLPCGEAVVLPDTGDVNLLWTEGDTYYQRYDCLKTYAFTNEDVNQVVEILSFMCETRTNIDGRYDKNRGQSRSYMMNPTNFNLINPVYSQKNNFFTGRKTVRNKGEKSVYPNQITYSKTKESGADVDLYTNITLASVLELDGDKGQITSLNRLNDQIIAFQDKGISQILYNENVQIASTAGVPIEIANSQKVQGKRYITNTVGCSNKWSIATTPGGLYFMDSNHKDIYLFNGQLANISQKAGFNTWAKQTIPAPDIQWNPVDFNNFVSYYDYLNQDVLFINKDIALAFSEKTGTFTSFYDYGNTPYLVNLDDTELWIREDGSIWEHRGSNEYCKFFNSNKAYWMKLVGNPEPTTDKIFTNLEFRACVDGESSIPFDELKTWNEYQEGEATLSIKNGHSLYRHHERTGTIEDNSLIRKFRIWRCDIPRDKVHKQDRMRNPWLYLQLKKEVPETGSLPRAEIHDIIMTYFN